MPCSVKIRGITDDFKNKYKEVQSNWQQRNIWEALNISTMRLTQNRLNLTGSGMTLKTSGEYLMTVTRFCAVLKIIELSNEINHEIDKLISLKSDAHSKIEKVCNRKFISLLTDIYISGYTLEQVAENADKTYMTICRWHGQALQIFRKENNMT